MTTSLGPKDSQVANVDLSVAQVAVATLDSLHRLTFSADEILVDKASQSTALQIASALDHCPKARRLVFVGDPSQLPPYCSTDQAMRTGCFSSTAAVSHWTY